MGDLKHKFFFAGVLGLTHDECVRKMRLLSFCSLASEESNFSFAKAAECMQVEQSEVERWVIRAVGAKLVDARMDQQAKVITIKFV